MKISSDGLQNECKACRYNRRKLNIEKSRQYAREYCKQHRVEISNKQSERYKALTLEEKHAQRQIAHVRDLKSKYGMSIEEFIILRDKQENKCAICGKEETRKSTLGFQMNLSVDHDHKTGKIRGLLCKKCNTAIGSLFDDTQLLTKAISYIIQHRKEV
jgi:hypothetical protein